ncbi:hypothetical protein, partial [Pseudomonas sp. Kh13]|uniref:hypothetical protein n=1 Tax=Pseudomonas sp. Kh13 TaxID=2093744 RepID=UPI001C497E7A
MLAVGGQSIQIARSCVGGDFTWHPGFPLAAFSGDLRLVQRGLHHRESSGQLPYHGVGEGDAALKYAVERGLQHSALLY